MISIISREDPCVLRTISIISKKIPAFHKWLLFSFQQIPAWWFSRAHGLCVRRSQQFCYQHTRKPQTCAFGFFSQKHTKTTNSYPVSGKNKRFQEKTIKPYVGKGRLVLEMCFLFFMCCYSISCFYCVCFNSPRVLYDFCWKTKQISFCFLGACWAILLLFSSLGGLVKQFFFFSGL